MRNRFVVSLALAAALVGAGCNGPLGVSPSRLLGQAGPGADDHSCLSETPPSPVTPSTIAEATADGGQRASNHPVQSDPGARGIHTVWTRGGETTDSSTTNETRQQAGAPSVNQGLVLPTSAEVGGGSQAVNEAAKTVASLRAALQLALASNAPNVDLISKMLADAQTALANAEAGARPVVTYNLQGAVSTQTVANGSAAGSDGGSVSAPGTRIRQPSGAPTAPGAPAVAAPEPPAVVPAAPTPVAAPGMGG